MCMPGRCTRCARSRCPPRCRGRAMYIRVRILFCLYSLLLLWQRVRRVPFFAGGKYAEYVGSAVGAWSMLAAAGREREREVAFMVFRKNCLCEV